MRSKTKYPSVNTFHNILLRHDLIKHRRKKRFQVSGTNLGLTQLSVWWIRLGIELERITLGASQENGRHERIHLTLVQELLGSPAPNNLAQQEKFDNYLEVYNYQRPHQALKSLPPCSVYKRSEKKFTRQLEEINYSLCHDVKIVSENGGISSNNGKRVFISEAFAGQPLGLTKIDDTT